MPRSPEEAPPKNGGHRRAHARHETTATAPVKRVPTLLRSLSRLTLTATLASALIACGGGAEEPVAAAEDPGIGILDYRDARIFDDISGSNRLLIDVSSRLMLSDGSSRKRYLLLHNHPREITFEPVQSVYQGVIDDARGASDITFIYSLDDTTTIVSRRYAAAETANPADMHECRASDYSRLEQPRELRRSEVQPLFSFEDIVQAAASTATVVGRFETVLPGGRTATLDFPVQLINIDPRTRSDPSNPAFRNWQAVSAQLALPVTPGEGSDCRTIRPGYVAFRSLEGAQSAVYLCLAEIDGRLMDDFVCTAQLHGTLNLFRVR